MNIKQLRLLQTAVSAVSTYIGIRAARKEEDTTKTMTGIGVLIANLTVFSYYLKYYESDESDDEVNIRYEREAGEWVAYDA